jgi:fructoselysine-6-P-deglycase FrlB-like protein
VGKPFAEEIDLLDGTYRWAISTSAPNLAEHLSLLFAAPLTAAGSGGSLTTAEIAATLFWSLGLGLSTAVTPAELAARAGVLRGSSVFVATASGSNPDVRGAVRVAANCEASSVLALCATLDSRLAKDASRYSNVRVAEFALRSGRDGFLATNSLLASAVLLVRGFHEATGVRNRLPKSLAAVLDASSWRSFVRTAAEESASLWSCETVLVLHGPFMRAAAVDLESKLTEAALVNCSTADYRHFAHGRHHWIAKHGKSTSVIAFVTPEDKYVAQRTLAELPSTTPRLVIELDEGPGGLLAALAHVFPLVQACGRVRCIDPGRPGVPSFGRRIYHLNAFGRNGSRKSDVPDNEEAAIGRKTGKSRARLEREGEYRFWRDAYQRSRERINSQRYASVVFDFDGTLCAAEERFAGCREQVSELLTRLVHSGLRVGIATGRGKSVRNALQASLPEAMWSEVIVGYYNGGQIGRLADAGVPEGSDAVEKDFAFALEGLRRSKSLLRLAIVEPRARQITITPKSSMLRSESYQLLRHFVSTMLANRAKLLCSTHSFDLLPVDVSKLNMVRYFARGDGEETLTIGDMGCWPGNDYELLTHTHSLSVDQVSPDPSTCWNFAYPGVRGVEATLDYFASAKGDSAGRIRLAVGKSSRRRALR